MEELLARIQTRTARIGVGVVGLGEVGLPLTVECATAGTRCAR